MRNLTTMALLACGLLCGCPESGKTPAPSAPAGAAPAAPAAATAKPADNAGDAMAAKPADKPAEKASSAHENFWKEVGVGTVIEQHSVTDMVKPMAMKTESTTTITLKAKTDKDYTTSTTTAMANIPAQPARDTTTPWETDAPAAAASDAPKPTDMGEDSVTVGSDTLKCKHWQTTSETMGVKSTTDTWMHKGFMVKMVMKNDNMTMTTETTKIDKK
jgi:hypothetical protein